MFDINYVSYYNVWYGCGFVLLSKSCCIAQASSVSKSHTKPHFIEFCLPY